MIQVTYNFLRRMVIIVVGFTTLLLGVIMLVTPGPGIAVLLIGLSILASEILWARLLLIRLKRRTRTYSRGLLGWLQKHYQPGETLSRKQSAEQLSNRK
jgi:uncharacterized protein (TIGR02611 family)